MKKGITPIISVIVLLLITIALAGTAWTFFNSQLLGRVGKQISVQGFCVEGTKAYITVTNMGVNAISLGSCNTAGSVSNKLTICGDIIITRTDGGVMDAQFDKNSIAPMDENKNHDSAIFSDNNCTVSGVPRTCAYTFSLKTSANEEEFGEQAKKVSVKCSGSG